jgi:5-methylcytosine-specific restriction endonuclease McrA
MTTSKLDQPVLVLNRAYLPIGKVPVRVAICLIYQGKANPIELSGERGWTICSVSVDFYVPRQIVLTNGYIERAWRVRQPNRREIFKRDSHTCLYCGSKKDLTIDHVMPKSRGGQDSWENLVTCCGTCNQKKGSNTPEEARMCLTHKPRPPIHPAVAFAEELWSNTEDI